MYIRFPKTPPEGRSLSQALVAHILPHFNSINHKQQLRRPRRSSRSRMLSQHGTLPRPHSYSSLGVSTSHIVSGSTASCPTWAAWRPRTVACLIVRQVRKTFCLAVAMAVAGKRKHKTMKRTMPKASKFMGTLESCGSNENCRVN